MVPLSSRGPSGPFIHCSAFKKRRMYWVPFNCLPAEGQRSGYSPEWFIFFPKSKPVSTAPTSTWVHFLYSGHKSMRLGTKAWERDGVIRCSQGAARTHLCLHFRTLIRFGGGVGLVFFKAEVSLVSSKSEQVMFSQGSWVGAYFNLREISLQN